MSASLLEIVDLGDGEIVLQRADDDSEPLVVIRFSEESRLYLMDNGLEVAKAMIQAGIQAAVVIAEQGELEVEAARQAKARSPGPHLVYPLLDPRPAVRACDLDLEFHSSNSPHMASQRTVLATARFAWT